MAHGETAQSKNHPQIKAQSKPRRWRQRGSVLVEMAMVLLPLMTITLGIVEIGAAWKDKSTAVQASRQGARVITSSSVANPDTGDPYLGDQQALLAVLAGLPDGVEQSGGAVVQVRKVIIFNADITDAQFLDCQEIGESGGSRPVESMPRSNSTGLGDSGRCNVYLAGNDADKNSLFFQAGSGLGVEDSSHFGGNSGDWDRKFNPQPSDRSNSLANPTEVGVYVELYRPYITGLIPGEGLKISGFTVMRIEPAGL